MATPRPGWTEQEPEDWWIASRNVLHRVVSESDQPPLALGLTGQMHGAVFLDQNDHVIRPALLWNDQRTERQCQDITAKVGRERLGHIAREPPPTRVHAPQIPLLPRREALAARPLPRVFLAQGY